MKRIINILLILLVHINCFAGKFIVKDYGSSGKYTISYYPNDGWDMFPGTPLTNTLILAEGYTDEDIYITLNGVPFDLSNYDYINHKFTITGTLEDIEAVIGGIRLKKYKVALDLNYNSLVPDTLRNIEHGSKLVIPSPPQRTGYTLAGWYTDALCANAWDFATSLVTRDTTLYAKWNPIPYTITLPVRQNFRITGAGNEIITRPDTTIMYGSPFVFKIEPDADYSQSTPDVKAGIAQLTPDASGFYHIDPVTQDSVITVTGIVLNKYTVSFDSQGGTTISPAANASHGNTINPPADPTKTGHTFAGWYTNLNYTNPWLFGTSVVTGNITLYAKWIRHNYVVALPVIEGVSYNTPQRSSVGHGESFTFRPAVADKYTAITSIEASSGHRVIDNGDGSYTIGNVTENIQVFIYGVKRLYNVSLAFGDLSISEYVSSYPGTGNYEITKDSVMYIRTYLNNDRDEMDLRMIVNGDTITAIKETRQILDIAYLFRIPVTKDLDVKIISIKRDDPTGTIPPLKEGIIVYTIPNHVIIESSSSTGGVSDRMVHLYNVTGQLAYRQPLQEGTIKIPLKKGFYIVVIGNNHWKISIR
ncbi:MAG: InlB B-repeat-containing protein [Tannerella sp.]|jgi:uncharacterized repeat protein (TIGR02543 family)|nr:InlB B-repeat-containing protein [Tannerella sp.]